MLSEKARIAQYQASRKNPHSPIGFELRPERADAVVDQEGLRQQRRAAEEIDIGIGKGRQEAVPRHARIGDRHRQDGAQHDRDDDQRERYAEAAQVVGRVFGENSSGFQAATR